MRALLVLFGVVALAVATAWQAPATLVDAALDRASTGNLRLAEASGTIWRGQGVVMAIDPVSKAGRPWLGMEWSATLGEGGLVWRLSSGGEPLSRILLSLSGIDVGESRLRGPARYFMEQIPASAARASWLGDMALSTRGLRCSWRSQCRGQAELLWRNAASELLPGRPLGDYQLNATATEAGVAFQWRTLEGEVLTEGQGSWPKGGAPNFSGTVRGDAQFLEELPSVAGPWIRPGREPGVWMVTFP